MGWIKKIKNLFIKRRKKKIKEENREYPEKKKYFIDNKYYHFNEIKERVEDLKGVLWESGESEFLRIEFYVGDSVGIILFDKKENLLYKRKTLILVSKTDIVRNEIETYLKI